jgi:transcriptional regulator with XRE-family HTH domain
MAICTHLRACAPHPAEGPAPPTLQMARRLLRHLTGPPMLETDRTTTLDPPARLAVLLATTGLTQLDLARLLPVAGRTVRRWMEGVCKPPAVAFEQLEELAHTLDEDADYLVRAMGEQGSAAAALLVYRRDYDVPPSRGLRTVGYHLALVRRVAERRPDVQFVTYDRHRYRHWLGSRPDTKAMRNAWAASRVSGRTKADTLQLA